MAAASTAEGLLTEPQTAAVNSLLLADPTCLCILQQKNMHLLYILLEQLFFHSFHASFLYLKAFEIFKPNLKVLMDC